MTVTNTGPTTIHAITVADPAADPATCPTSQLAPGASMMCAATPHTVSAADAAAGHVTNVATASGSDPDGTPVTAPPTTATIAVESDSLPTRPRPTERFNGTLKLPLSHGRHSGWTRQDRRNRRTVAVLEPSWIAPCLISSNRYRRHPPGAQAQGGAGSDEEADVAGYLIGGGENDPQPWCAIRGSGMRCADVRRCVAVDWS